MFNNFTKKEFIESVINSISVLTLCYLIAVGFFSLF